MEQSILNSTKKMIGIDSSYTAFDLDILTHINSAFATLNQLGIGPAEGFSIENETAVWADFLGNDPKLNSVKTYVWLKVRFLFDPPQTSFHLTAMKDQIAEYEWRLNSVMEDASWVDPTPSC